MENNDVDNYSRDILLITKYITKKISNNNEIKEDINEIIEDNNKINDDKLFRFCNK